MEKTPLTPGETEVAQVLPEAPLTRGTSQGTIRQETRSSVFHLMLFLSEKSALGHQKNEAKRCYNTDGCQLSFVNAFVNAFV